MASKASKDVYSPVATGDTTTDRNLQAIADVIGAIGSRIGGAFVLPTSSLATTVPINAAANVVRYVGKGDSLTLPAANAQGTGIGQAILVQHLGSGVLTVRSAGTDTINGYMSVAIPVGMHAIFLSSAAGKWTAGPLVFGASGAAHAAGLVPDPGSVAGTTRFLREDGTWATGTPVTDVQVFTVGGTWTKPTGAKETEAILVGAGGGGASGRRGAAATPRCGGGAGGAGGISRWTWPSSILGATEAVTVAAGGTGGAAVAVDSTDGANGSTGSDTSFGAWLVARGGVRGIGGTAAGASAGGIGGAGNSGNGGAGGAGADAATGVVAVAGGVGTIRAGGGGGGAGGITAGNAQVSAAAGGAGAQDRPTGTAAGTSGGTTVAGGAGGSATTNESAGGGGGGGGSANGAGNNTGGAAGIYGAGGGGGGASLNGTASGAGGAGGSGLVIVVSYF